MNDARNGGCSDRDRCRECPSSAGCRERARIPGLRRHETCAEAEERKWIAYKFLRRPRVLDHDERRALDLVFALEGGSRQVLAVVSKDLGISTSAAARLVRTA